MEFTEDLELVKRKMEAQGGGEMRRLHIIYCLSWKGRIEHPHLIRVHHSYKNGVHLRDVKRWLSQLRGKDMPELFAWSYKRRYKTGYVWQDLMDEDLITPISDNEYILKGSAIPSTNFDIGSPMKVSNQKELPDAPDDHQANTKDHKEEHKQNPETRLKDGFKNSSSEIEEQSTLFESETSSLTDDSRKVEEEEEKRSETNEFQETTQEEIDNSENSFSFYSTLLSKKKKKKNKEKENQNNNVENYPKTSSSPSFGKSKSCKMLRNLISCGAVDTKDSAMVIIKKSSSYNSYVPTIKPEENSCDYYTSSEFCNSADKLRGFQRIFATPWSRTSPIPSSCGKMYEGMKNSNNKSGFNYKQKPVSAAYKPINGPNCSQCGKMFKPEKMHAHMKYCRGIKKSKAAKGSGPATNAASEARRSMDSSSQESVSVSGYYLSN